MHEWAGHVAVDGAQPQITLLHAYRSKQQFNMCTGIGFSMIALKFLHLTSRSLTNALAELCQRERETKKGEESTAEEEITGGRVWKSRHTHPTLFSFSSRLPPQSGLFFFQLNCKLASDCGREYLLLLHISARHLFVSFTPREHCCFHDEEQAKASC